MATISTTYGYQVLRQEKKNGDRELSAIIQDVQNYLKNTERKRFFLSITIKYHKRCSKSWAKIGFYLQKFLNDPKANYSMLMFTLEQEINKFPKKSFYGEQLQQLYYLISSGPSFSDKPKFYL